MATKQTNTAAFVKNRVYGMKDKIFYILTKFSLAALHPPDDCEPFFKNRKFFGAVQRLNIFRSGLRRTFFFIK